MELLINKPGLLSTLQDTGRLFHRAEGVPVSGAMDLLSARIANRAVGNDDKAAVIEFTYGDTALRAVTPLLIAASGEGSRLCAEGRILPDDRPLYIPGGTSLTLETIVPGARLYLAVAGGWEIPEVLGSKSTYIPAGIGGYEGRALQKGDRLVSGEILSVVSKNIVSILTGDKINYPSWSIARRLLRPAGRGTIRVMRGREFDWFEPAARERFFSTVFRVSTDSNRMGYRLEGSLLKRNKQEELISTAVAPGTIQVSGNGGVIMLMADAQTTGGYPRIAQVAAVDLSACGQLRPGDDIMFTEISGNEAERLYFVQEEQLAELTAAIAAETYKIR